MPQDRVFTRVYNSRYAPRLVHCICCFLEEPFAHHLIHRGLHKARGDGLAIPIPLAIVRNQVRKELLVFLERQIEMLKACGILLLKRAISRAAAIRS